MTYEGTATNVAIDVEAKAWDLSITNEFRIQY